MILFSDPAYFTLDGSAFFPSQLHPHNSLLPLISRKGARKLLTPAIVMKIATLITGSLAVARCAVISPIGSTQARQLHHRADPPPPASEDWEYCKCKGQSLLWAMCVADVQAGNAFLPPLPRAQSKFVDFPRMAPDLLSTKHFADLSLQMSLTSGATIRRNVIKIQVPQASASITHCEA